MTPRENGSMDRHGGGPATSQHFKYPRQCAWRARWCPKHVQPGSPSPTSKLSQLALSNSRCIRQESKSPSQPPPFQPRPSPICPEERGNRGPVGVGSNGSERPENNCTAWNQSAHTQSRTPPVPLQEQHAARLQSPSRSSGSSRLHTGPCFQESENVSTHRQRTEKASRSLEGPKLSSLTTVIRMALALYGRTALSSPSPSAEDLYSEPTLFEFEACQEGRGSSGDRRPL